MFSGRSMRTVYGYRFKEAIVTASLVCGIAGVVTAVTAPGSASSWHAASVSVDRTNKGDRLHSASTLKTNVDKSLSAAAPKPPPFGCDAALSLIVHLTHAHIYRRCVV